MIRPTGSRVVYENRWMRVREDAITRPDGSAGIYGVVEKPNFVVIIPVEEDGAMHLVEQYRYAVGARFWEFPQGAWETTPGTDPLVVARGELREETGLEAAAMTEIGHLFQSYGYATQGFHVYLAQGLTPTVAERDFEEQDLVTRRFPLAEVLAMIRRGDIKDASSIAALGLLQITGAMPGLVTSPP